MWQVALPLQLILPLAPTVVVQVELLAQFRLHEAVHAPEQTVWFSQDSEQLPASPPQVAALKSQLIPELQVQPAPVQTGGGTEEDPPQTQSNTCATGPHTLLAVEHGGSIPGFGASSSICALLPDFWPAAPRCRARPFAPRIPVGISRTTRRLCAVGLVGALRTTRFWAQVRDSVWVSGMRVAESP